MNLYFRRQDGEMCQEPYVTVDEIARRYSIKRAAAGDWLRDGLIRGERMGHRWYTTWDALFAFEGRFCSPQGSARKAAMRPLLTVSDLAARFTVTTATIREWLRKEMLPGKVIRGTWYVASDDLERCCGLEQLGPRRAVSTHINTHSQQLGTGLG